MKLRILHKILLFFAINTNDSDSFLLPTACHTRLEFDMNILVLEYVQSNHQAFVSFYFDVRLQKKYHVVVVK